MGRVACHESFKFESQKYFNIKYHYRSLETWLDGVCRSWCEKHSWQVMRFSVTRGNNYELLVKFFSREMLEMFNVNDGTSFLSKLRSRWTHKPIEDDYK